MELQLPDGYQPGGTAWSPDRPDLIELLTNAVHADLQPIYYGSNHTFLVTLDAGAEGRSLAVYKPARGEYPLHDFPAGTLYKREIASWLLDTLLGWALVPPTVRTHGRYGPGSLQLFIEVGGRTEIEIDELRRIALLDVLINNADRKVEHCLPDFQRRLWAIDHGLTFHVQPKLRTFLWHFAGTRLSRDEYGALRRLKRELQTRRDPCAAQLADLVSRSEWNALRDRINRLIESGSFPDPRYKPVPYRW